jgi:hypothetical protein
MLLALPPLALTFATNGLAPSCLATFALGDMVAMLFHVAHDTISDDARAKAAEQAVECLAGPSFNFRHPFTLPFSLRRIEQPCSKLLSLVLAKTDLAVAPHNQL